MIGRLVDRFGIVLPVIGATLTLGVAFIASGLAPNLMTVRLANLLIGVGSSATFAPLIADISHWFTTPAAASPSPSAPRATTWAARSGRRSCSG